MLCLEHENVPVEYGVIKIDLSRFDRTALRQILDEQKPLGQILLDGTIAHTSWPQAFLRVTANSHIQAALALPQSAELFGRRNIILDGCRRMLADVIEILPPLNSMPNYE